MQAGDAACFTNFFVAFPGFIFLGNILGKLYNLTEGERVLRPDFNLVSNDLAGFCKRWLVSELSVFGSVLRDDFRDDSDIDILVSFHSEAKWTLFELASMRDELKEIFGREVDLLTRKGLESSRNYLRRKSILAEAEKIYAA